MILRELIAKFGLDFDAKSFKQADNAVNDLKASAGKLVAAIAVFEIGAKLKSMVEGTIDAARSVGGMASKIGIGTDALQELQYAAQQSGIEVQDFNKTFTLMSVQLGKALQGDQGSADKFNQLGISLHDVSGKAKTADVIFENIADKMQGAKTQVERLAIAADFFGVKAGTKFASALKNGSAGIRELRQEAHDLGGVMSEDMIAEAKEAHHVMLKFEYALQGVKNTIVGALLPTISEVASASLVWFRANREFIKSRLDTYVHKIANAAKTAGKWIFAIARLVSAGVTLIGGFERAITLLAIALGVMLVAQIGEAILGFASLNAAMLVTKLAMFADALAMGAAFVLLAAVIGLVGEEIESLFDDKKQGLFETMSGKWSNLTDQLIANAKTTKSVWGAVLSFIGAMVSEAADIIDTFLDETFKWLTKIGDLWDSFFDIFDPTRNATTKAMFDIIGRFMDFAGRKDVGSSRGMGIADLISPSHAIVAATAGGGNTTITTTITAPIDASGQSLDEAQVGDIVSRHIENAMTNANAVALQSLTPAVSP